MSSSRQSVLVAITIAAASLGGCSIMRDDVRPMIAIDGDRMEVQDPVANGRALLVTGQYGLAIDALSRVVHDDPTNVHALNLIAEAYARLRRFDLADRYHGEALEIDPNSVAALNNWGFSYLVRGDKTHAIALLERAEAIEGSQPVVLANLTLAAGEQPGQPVDASQSATLDSETGDIPIGDHVIIVRRKGKVIRIAPSVQLLVTNGASAQEPTEPIALRGGQIAPLPYIAAQPEHHGDDLRMRNLAALQRLLDPLPFSLVSDVDNFSVQADMGSAAGSRQAAMLPGLRLAGYWGS